MSQWRTTMRRIAWQNLDELSDVATCSARKATTYDGNSDTVTIDSDNNNLDNAYSTSVSETRLRCRLS